ncbi:MAG: THC0290_0291 family protein [Flavobacterium sp.]
MQIFRFSIIAFLSLLLFSQKATSQMRSYQELGVFTGPLLFFSDYGERGNFQNDSNNNGFGIGVSHYVNFAYIGYRDNSIVTFLREHIKLKSEFSYSKSDLRHYGKYVENAATSKPAFLLSQMRNETQIISLGIGGEFSIRSIHNFEMTNHSLSPHISFGAQISYYDPHNYTLLGLIDNPDVVFPKYLKSIDNSSGFAGSVIGGIGCRYKIDVLSDFILDLKYQHYFSDWIEGVNPDPARFKENKANDGLMWLSFGYIRYFEF